MWKILLSAPQLKRREGNLRPVKRRRAKAALWRTRWTPVRNLPHRQERILPLRKQRWPSSQIVEDKSEEERSTRPQDLRPSSGHAHFQEVQQAGLPASTSHPPTTPSAAPRKEVPKTTPQWAQEKATSTSRVRWVRTADGATSTGHWSLKQHLETWNVCF